MSEFELNLLRQRSLEAIRQKARRGELQFRLPVGFRWTQNGKVEMDPDRRVQEAVHLVFAKAGGVGKRAASVVVVSLRKDALPALVLDSPGRQLSSGSYRCTTRSGTWFGIRCMPALMHSAKQNREPR